MNPGANSARSIAAGESLVNGGVALAQRGDSGYCYERQRGRDDGAGAMTPKGTLFFDEWQACLRAHYVHVIRTQDTVTEPTLRHVLLTTGLTEDELDALRAEALDTAGDAYDAVELPPAPVVTPLPDEQDLPDDPANEEDLMPEAILDALMPDEPDLPIELPPDAAGETAVADPGVGTGADAVEDGDETPERPFTPSSSQLSLF